MKIFDAMDTYENNILSFFYEPVTDLKAVISINNTTLGPAIGGTRMAKYENEDDLILDALKLGRNMTYQSAITEQDAGGGKAILVGDPESDKSEAQLRAFGRYVESYKGLFITTADMGINDNDVKTIFRETHHVFWERNEDRFTSEGVTAHGVLAGMKACMSEKFNTTSLEGVSIAIQGVGHVGRNLIKLLIREKVGKIYITDVRYDPIKTVQDQHPNVEIVAPEDIIFCDVDILAPCAVGGLINDESIPQIKAGIIAGSAQSVLKSFGRHGQALHERGILYAPDFIIGSSEVIRGLLQYTRGMMDERFQPSVEDAADRIFRILLKVFKHSRKEDIPTTQAALELAKLRMHRMGKVKNIFCGE